MARMPFKDAERVRMQSTDEWLEEYETGNKIIPQLRPRKNLNI